MNSHRNMDADDIFDEYGTYLSIEDRQKILKAFEAAKPIINTHVGNLIVFGTSHPFGGSIEQDFQKIFMDSPVKK